MNHVYLLTGGNIGDRLLNLQTAIDFIQKQVGQVLKQSLIYETAAWGLTEQPSFLNQVLSVQSQLEPEDLLTTILLIEQQLGRTRHIRMGPRTIDIDILFYNSQVISTSRLTVPHPEIATRRFVLTPLNEIAPAFVHPVLGKTVEQLLQDCPDELPVNVYAQG